jgi:hypothetical protein
MRVSGTLDLGETPSADVRLDVAFSDTRPLVAFLSRDKPLKGWKERLLAIERQVPRQGRWRIYGLRLPDEVLEKVYLTNATRLLGLDAGRW